MPREASLAPTAARERYGFLDVLRGVAILGILPENIPLMGLPTTLADVPHVVTSAGWREPLAFHLTRFFGDYKFLSIFSLLFGVGLALPFERCRATRRGFRGLYVRRLAVLAMFGAAHACLIWAGDILAFYALLGLVVMWAANWTPRRLARVGAILLAVPCVMLLALSALAPFRASLPEGVGTMLFDPPTFSDWREDPATFLHLPLEQRLSHLPAWETHVFRDGGYVAGTVLRAFLWLTGLAGLIPYVGWRVAGLFLIGMAWMRAGWFASPREHLPPFRRLAVWGAAVGVPIQTAAVALPLAWPRLSGIDALAEALQYAGSLGMSAIYVYLVARLVTTAGDAAVTRALAAIGRAALSNYILQSLLCTFVFYSHGLAWFGRFDRMQLWGVVLACWGANVGLSVTWMRRFQFGPLEWLWRRLTYGRVLARPGSASG